MAASNSMNVDLTGSQPSELVEGASTRLTRDALSQLRSPKASDLARSRVVSSNKKKGDSGRGPGKVSKKSTTLKTNFVDTRIREFKDEPFRKSNNKLFCEACREELSEKASIIKRHVDSQKHKSGVEKIAKKKKRDLTVLDAMKNYDKEVHPKGEMLSDNQRVFRVRVLKTFLKAGVPLQKWTISLIPFVRKEEEEMIKGEISGHNVSVIFDGTTRLAMRDGASVNGAAMRTVKVVFPKVVDVRCFSHAIDGIGSHFNIPTLRRFLQLWNALFGHSPATRIAWKERTGISNKSYSPTRWWSWWEVANQIMLQFAEIHPFLQARLQEAANKATLRQLDEMLANAQTKLLLQIELAAVVDAGKPMVESTYILEGDGTLAWQCYEQLLIIQNSINGANLPNLTALSGEVSGGNVAVAQQYHQYGIAAIRPGWEYFANTVMGVMGPQVEMFKAARLFSPRHITQLRPVAND
ncbi:unnamed protein product, partial [Porites evermanni]